MQPRVLIVHEVADYEAWKRVFDLAAEIRREAGERSNAVPLSDQRRNVSSIFSWS